MDVLPLYARDRNKMVPGHDAVSRLSPAIRHRLVDGNELVELALTSFRFSRIEKWIQEVCWRSYWKGWLEQRPQVWEDYCLQLSQPWPAEVVARCTSIEAADSGNAIIDAFARELSETGYLHNHARMWVAAWWIHQERLPWELGAAWFFRHLLDGDPASNTLSWRWVAGLQTPGKTYLARRSNLEKYLDATWLDKHAKGLAAFEKPEALSLEAPPLLRPVPFPDPVLDVGPTPAGLWIHEEDLSPESMLPGTFQPQSIAVSAHASAWQRAGFPSRKQAWLLAALDDAAGRAMSHWRMKPERLGGEDLAPELSAWATRAGLRRIVTLRPPVGLLAQEISGLSAALARSGIELTLLDRQVDVGSRAHATGGFFKFWEKVRPGLVGAAG